MIIIGIDCATDASKTGLALSLVQGHQILIKEVTKGSKSKTPLTIASEWLSRNHPALLAFDAPLGWPESSRLLADHVAGQSFSIDKDNLFSRETDRIVRKEIKKPFDIGASWIARTAYSALELLNDLRQKTGLEIPLAWEWEMGKIKDTCAIEVYPAGTLNARRYERPQKDDNSARDRRRQLLEKLHIAVHVQASSEAIENSHAFDAVICVLAASDFLLGKCIPIPADKIKQVKKEGWIWVKNPLAYL